MNIKTNKIDMCHGPLAKKIMIYSIPLMITNILQVLFNMADVAVVGRFVGPLALGAVGSTSVIITLTTGLMIGMAAGVNAITALYIGAKDKENIKKTVHTSVVICLFAGIFILLCGVLFSRTILMSIHTKKELIDQATLYMKVYLCGAPALALYNYGNAILSAIGDTKRPLKYLTISGILNVLLNLLFVVVFRMGVFGVACASIISQYVSAILILRCLLCCKEVYGLKISQISMDRDIALRVLRISIPSAIQYSLFELANLFVQRALNSFDHIVVEGNSAAVYADTLVYDMMAAFYTACTSFIAQNYGARKKARILKTYIITIIYPFVAALVIGVLLVIFKRQFLSIFTKDPRVIKTGSVRITIMGFSYCISALMDNATAAARGIGKSLMPTIIVIMGSVVFRVVWIYTIFAYFHTTTSLYLLYVFSWIATAIAGNIYFIWHYRKIEDLQYS